LPGDVVDRLLFASLSCVTGPVFEEMHRIGDRAIQRNVPDGVYVALLYQAGWFMEWMEGPPAGLEAVLQRVAGRPPPPRAARRAPQQWPPASYPTMVDGLSQRHQDDESVCVARAGPWQSGRSAGLEPAAVWRRLSMPLKNEGGARIAASDSYQRVMVVSARGTASFDLVHWLGERYESEVAPLRMTGVHSRVRDVASDYVDVGGGKGASLRRVVAMARNGLQLGLTQAFLPDYSHLIVLLSGDARHDADLMCTLVAACSRMAHRPVVIGFGRAGCDHVGLQEQARAGRMMYLDCGLGASSRPPDLWAVVEPALDFSRSTKSAS
jgi:hypothetical protein